MSSPDVGSAILYTTKSTPTCNTQYPKKPRPCRSLPTLPSGRSGDSSCEPPKKIARSQVMTEARPSLIPTHVTAPISPKRQPSWRQTVTQSYEENHRFLTTHELFTATGKWGHLDDFRQYVRNHIAQLQFLEPLLEQKQSRIDFTAYARLTKATDDIHASVKHELKDEASKSFMSYLSDKSCEITGKHCEYYEEIEGSDHLLVAHAVIKYLILLENASLKDKLQLAYGNSAPAALFDFVDGPSLKKALLDKIDAFGKSLSESEHEAFVAELKLAWKYEKAILEIPTESY